MSKYEVQLCRDCEGGYAKANCHKPCGHAAYIQECDSQLEAIAQAAKGKGHQIECAYHLFKGGVFWFSDKPCDCVLSILKGDSK